MKIYLSGPVTGMPGLNRAAFDRAAERLRALGHEVVNPLDTDHLCPHGDWAEYMRKDLPLLVACDAVAVLPGWRRSKGASLEVAVARALGMPILDADTLEAAAGTETILEEAQRLIYGARQQVYGHPRDDFARTAAMWEVLLAEYRQTGRIRPEHVALCLIAVKLSRFVNGLMHGHFHRDSVVDIAGYAGTLEALEEPLE